MFKENALEKVLICQHLLPSSVVSSKFVEDDKENSKMKELHLKVKGKHQKDLRKELLGTSLLLKANVVDLIK